MGRSEEHIGLSTLLFGAEFLNGQNPIADVCSPWGKGVSLGRKLSLIKEVLFVLCVVQPAPY